MTRKQIGNLFRSNLRQLREEAGLSQSEVGRRMGVTPGYICDLERGRRSPQVGTLAVLGEALGVSPYHLISGYLPPKKTAAARTVAP